jgi:hypothetical protein
LSRCLNCWRGGTARTSESHRPLTDAAQELLLAHHRTPSLRLDLPLGFAPLSFFERLSGIDRRRRQRLSLVIIFPFIQHHAGAGLDDRPASRCSDRSRAQHQLSRPPSCFYDRFVDQERTRQLSARRKAHPSVHTVPAAHRARSSATVATVSIVSLPSVYG